MLIILLFSQIMHIHKLNYAIFRFYVDFYIATLWPYQKVKKKS